MKTITLNLYDDTWYIRAETEDDHAIFKHIAGKEYVIDDQQSRRIVKASAALHNVEIIWENKNG